MDQAILDIYDESLRRCNAQQGFLDRFYLRFMASSPKVRSRFENTDFARQKLALRASLHTMALAVRDGEQGLEKYLRDLAEKHSKEELDIGAALYDYWLDALLATVREYDPKFGPEVEEAWEGVMQAGIQYLISHYDSPPREERRS